MIISIFPNENEAKKIAIILLQDRLVACVNIIPKIKSLYWWKNKIHEEEEVFMMIKAREEFETNIISKIKKLHTYDTPAIYSIKSTEKIDKEYLNWIYEETKII